jgi:hypothetical protein
MNVAVLEPKPEPRGAISEPEPAGAQSILASEWIDPEGDDWLSQIYHELRDLDGSAAVGNAQAEPIHWFG